MESTACAECHLLYPLDEMIRHGNIFVCGTCKPRFVQKLAEGAAVPGTVRYAGFWRRYLAVLIDAILLAIVNFILQMAILLPSMSMLSSGDPANLGSNIAVIVLLYGIQIATGFTYETVLICKYGSTLGKTVCGLEVVTAEGRPLSYGLSVGRYFAKLLSVLTLFIGYIIAAFDEEKRSLHDRICNTRVVMK